MSEVVGSLSDCRLSSNSLAVVKLPVERRELFSLLYLLVRRLTFGCKRAERIAVIS